VTTNQITTSDRTDYIGARIMEIIRHYGLNRNSFSIKIGLSSNSLIVRITNNPDAGMSLDLIQKILKAFPDINPGWFVIGEGEMLRKPVFPDPKLHYIKYYGDYQNKKGKVVDLLRLCSFEDCDSAFDVVGTAMSPKYMPGDIAICKRVNIDGFLQYGEAFLIITEDGPIFRYIKSKIDNKEFRLSAEDSRYDESTIETKNVLALYMIKGLIRKEVV
jgi:hypothetical protein